MPLYQTEQDTVYVLSIPAIFLEKVNWELGYDNTLKTSQIVKNEEFTLGHLGENWDAIGVVRPEFVHITFWQVGEA